MRPSILIRPALAVCAVASLALLTGCAVYPAGYYGGSAPYYGSSAPYYGSQAPYYGASGDAVYAPIAPPPLIVESPMAAPFPGHIWIGGYWGWNGSRHMWTPGRWEAPRAGQRWVPRRWEQGQRGWQQHGGHWERH